MIRVIFSLMFVFSTISLTGLSSFASSSCSSLFEGDIDFFKLDFSPRLLKNVSRENILFAGTGKREYVAEPTSDVYFELARSSVSGQYELKIDDRKNTYSIILKNGKFMPERYSIQKDKITYRGDADIRFADNKGGGFWTPSDFFFFEFSTDRDGQLNMLSIASDTGHHGFALYIKPTDILANKKLFTRDEIKPLQEKVDIQNRVRTETQTLQAEFDRLIKGEEVSRARNLTHTYIINRIMRNEGWEIQKNQDLGTEELWLVKVLDPNLQAIKIDLRQRGVGVGFHSYLGYSSRLLQSISAHFQNRFTVSKPTFGHNMSRTSRLRFDPKDYVNVSP